MTSRRETEKQRRAEAKLRAARQRRAGAYEWKWERKRKRWLAQMRGRFGATFDGFSEFGEPLFKGRPPLFKRGPAPRTLRGPEFVRTLELVRDATGNPIFDYALRTAHVYGFNTALKQNAARVQEQIFVTSDEGYFDQIDFLRHRGRLEGGKQNRRRKLSIREAVECVVAESGLVGKTFESACQQLRERYLARGARELTASDHDGDIGLILEVTPVNGAVPGPDGRPLKKKSRQRATSYWWRRFHDGDVAIRLVPDLRKTNTKF
jgi:hypothetical protein